MATPAASAIVFGDIWGVNGAYTKQCIELGCQRVLLIDSYETPAWLRTRLEHPQLDFYKGDFSNAAFMSSIRERFEIGVAFDVLLHQPALLHTLHLMLQLVTDRLCIALPVLAELETPNALVYLPGNPDPNLYPLSERSPGVLMFDPLEVNSDHWIWGITRSLLRSVLTGEGFTIVSERDGPTLPNPQWAWWGCVAERTLDNPQLWANTIPPQVLADER